jgi:hypothetical protein
LGTLVHEVDDFLRHTGLAGPWKNAGTVMGVPVDLKVEAHQEPLMPRMMLAAENRVCRSAGSSFATAANNH